MVVVVTMGGTVVDMTEVVGVVGTGETLREMLVILGCS